MKKIGVLIGLIAGIYFTASSTAFAAILQFDSSGQLAGANSVDVNGVFYDVVFTDGDCATLFSGCDTPSDFIFDDAGAVLAAQALLDQVFVNGPLGNFDMQPSLTRGCESLFSWCDVLIPVQNLSGQLSGRIAHNGLEQSNTNENFVGFFTGGATFDTAFFDLSVYGVFSLSDISDVPIPAAPFLFLTGLTGIGLARRKRVA